MQDVYISINYRYIEITISNIKIFIIYLPNFQRAPNNVQPCQNNTDQHCQNWALYKESLLRLILRTTCESQIGMFERWYDIHTSKILCTFFHLSAKRVLFDLILRAVFQIASQRDWHFHILTAIFMTFLHWNIEYLQDEGTKDASNLFNIYMSVILNHY